MKELEEKWFHAMCVGSYYGFWHEEHIKLNAMDMYYQIKDNEGIDERHYNFLKEKVFTNPYLASQEQLKIYLKL